VSVARIVDLFAGAGGLAEGFRQAGFAVAAGTDIDPDACASFGLNFPEAETVWGDIRTPVVKERVLHAARDAEVIVGGPPCQAFSQVRNHSRLIDDPRNSLYRQFVEIVGASGPKVFVMENVPGLEQMGVKEQVMSDLALRGDYRVSAQAVDAADFGVPQTRRRIVFIGIRRSLGKEPPTLVGTGAADALVLARFNGSYPIRYRVRGTKASTRAWLDRLVDPDDVSVVTAEQAIGDFVRLRAGTRADELASEELPEPKSAYQRLMREGLDGRVHNVSVPRINLDTVMRLREIPKGGNHRDLPEALLERYLTGARWGPDAGNGRLSRRHYYAYRRLHPRFWCWTLNTKADSVYHYAAPRALSVREFARIQSFPDRFVFTTDPRPGDLPGRIAGGAGHSRYRQVGNAVPPLLARAIAEALRNTLFAS
jgi:DNA (cytosine-5)-methyltransferase 1